MIKKAAVIGSSKGIGKAFLEALIINGYKADPLSSKKLILLLLNL